MTDVFSFQKARSVDTFGRPIRHMLDRIEGVLVSHQITVRIEFVQEASTGHIVISGPIHGHIVDNYLLGSDVLGQIAMAATAKMASSEVIEDERLQKRLRIDLTK